MAHQASVAPIPLLYRLFFLWIEPIATAVGAYYAHYQQEQYMHLTYDAFPLFADKLTALAGSVSTRESIVLTQLANMYFVFALNEALVLRASTDLRVWKVLLLGLLIADFGHLYSVKSAGLEVYWQFWHWNSIYWGNLAFVYVGASLRTAFLLGIGLTEKNGNKSKKGTR